MPESLDLQVLATALEEAGRPWEQDVTDMTAMTEDERRVRFGFTPPTDEPSLEDAAAEFEQKEAAGALESMQASVAADNIGAPTQYDLRNVGGTDYTSPVWNQGGCGSCVSFGVSAVLETTYARSHSNQKIDLSEAHLFYCHAASEGRTCANGWWPENAIKKARDIGVTTEPHFPYVDSQQSCNLQWAWSMDLAKAVGYVKCDTPAKMKDWISTRGSITGCFNVYQDFFSYRSGVYRHVTGGLAGGHCVEIIGYDDAQRCWICKNSWGQNWGEGGYFRIAYGQCNIENYSGPWGVTGVTFSTWRRDVHVRGLWSNSSADNAHVYFDTVGWRRLGDSGTEQNHSMLTQCAAAKTANRKVDIWDDNGTVKQLYA
jgi:C1A family cysteine protease